MESLSFTGHGGVRLFGDRFGAVDDPIVILLHGGGQTRHSWAGTARALAHQGWCAITVDARGHGDSEWPSEGDYSLRAFALDVVELINVLGRSVRLVGASLGGSTTMYLEGEIAPGSASAAVLVDIVPQFETAGTDRIANFMLDRLYEGFGDLEEARDAIAAYNPHRPPPADLEGLKKNLRRGPDGRWRWHYDPRFVDGRRLGRGPSEITNQDLMRAACRKLEVPVLLVRGRMSDVVSMDGVRSFLSDVPHAEFVDVTGAGHMVAGDRNDAFTEAVVGFLDKTR